MVEFFRIGHFSIYLFSVTIAIGMFVGVFIMLREAKHKGVNMNKVMDLTLLSLLILQ